MYRIFLSLMIIITFTQGCSESEGDKVAQNMAPNSDAAPLSVQTLCAQLTLDEVTAIMGQNFEHRVDSDNLLQECKYSDSKENSKMKVRYFSLANSRLKESGWRQFVETTAKGKVIERDGMLVSHIRNDKFGTDSIWFRDQQGHALELNVNSGVTEEQAVALASAAMN